MKSLIFKLVVVNALLLICWQGTAQPAQKIHEQVRQSRTFREPIVWIGDEAPPENESKELFDALSSFKSEGAESALNRLEQFLKRHADSAWTPSVRAVLAKYYREHGQYTPALEHWEAAWKVTKDAKAGSAKQIADFTLVNWTGLLASLGRTEPLKAIFEQTKGRSLDAGPLQQRFLSNQEALGMMLAEPGRAYRCGTFALNSIAQALKVTNDVSRQLLNMDSPTNGFSMSQLAELSQRFGMDLVPVRRTEGQKLIVPSVVHWKQAHYAAIVGTNGPLFQVIDPTFGHAQWLTSKAINSEASGVFMVPQAKVPKEWQRISKSETDSIFGKGYPNVFVDDDDQKCPGEQGGGSSGSGSGSGGAASGLPKGLLNQLCPGCGGGSGGGDEECCDNTEQGMPRWRVSEPYINLWVEDEPLGYQPARGARVAFRLAYKQRDQTVWDTNNWFSVGVLWNCSWLSYVTPVSDVQADMYVPQGGKRRYYTDGSNPEYSSNTRMDKLTNGSGAFLGYKVTYPNGARDIYDFLAPGATWTNAFLTARINATGHTNRFEYTNYANVVRLLRVIDAQNQATWIHYATNHAYSSNLIARVVDPFGRETKLAYDSGGHLTNIIDVIGMTNYFSYDSSGWITNMTTPYGATRFEMTTVASVAGLETNNRTLLITEPNGSKQLYVYRDNCTSFLPGVYPDLPSLGSPKDNYLEYGYHYYRNSFFWNRQQFAAIADAAKTNLSTLTSSDFAIARLRHWFHRVGPVSAVGDALAIEREPSPTRDPIVGGQKTWYGYEGYAKVLKLKVQYPNNDTTQPARYTWNEYAGGAYAPDTVVYKLTNQVTTYGYGTVSERTRKFIYDTNNWSDLLAEIGWDGTTNVQYGYNGNHQVISEKNALGYWTTNTYNGNGQLATVTRSSGLTTTYSYDTNGYLTNIADAPIGRSESLTYDTNGLVRTHTDARGLTRTNSWDKLQRLTSAADGNGYVSNVYSRLDLTATRDRLGNWRYLTYDALRQKTAETNELGYATTYAYCECGAPNLIRDALTNITSFHHDLNGRMTNATYPGGLSVTYNYNILGQLTNVTDNAGSSVTNWYNHQGLMVAVSNAFGRVQATTYDIEDRATVVTDANGISITNTFDNLGRLLSRTYPDTGVERFGYSINNGFAGPIAYTNQLTNAAYYGYDAAGRKTAETNANNEVTQFKYDPAGNLTNLIDGKLQKTFWKYDQFGRVTNKVDHNTNDMFRYVYDANDRVTNRWTPAKGTTKYGYDVAGNLTSITYPTNPAITLQYDALNRLTTMVDAVGTTRYSYTGFGAISSEDGPWENDTVTYGYDNGRRRGSLSLQQPNAGPSTQSYVHDAAGRLSAVTSPAGTFTYGYPGPSSLVTNLALPNGARITNSYDNVGRLTATVLVNSTNGILDSHTYKYNHGNQRTNIVRTAGDYADYTYDGIGQLSTMFAKEPSGAPRLHERINYYYDAAGNLSRRDRPTGSGTPFQQFFTNNSLNQLTDVSRSGPLTVGGTVSSAATNITVNTSNAVLFSDYTFASTNHTLANGTNTFTAVARDNSGRTDTNSATIYSPTSASLVYDANGNLTFDGQKSYEWDDENQLVWLTATNAWRSQFVYDGKFRRRIRREFTWQNGAWVLANEVRYVYDRKLEFQWRDANNIPNLTLTRGIDLSGNLQGAGGIGSLLARTDLAAFSLSPSTSHSYFHSDALGSVTALIDSNQHPVAKYMYDPFGRAISLGGAFATANLYRLNSKEAHQMSDLTYYLRRYYDPGLQRWLNVDPLGEHGARGNLYRFVSGNPISGIDPWGLEDKKDPKKGEKKADNKKCCEKKDATPFKELADKFLTDLSMRVQEAEAEIGSKKVANTLDKINKAKFAIDAVRSICAARNPEGCDDFLSSGDLLDCMLCCTSIHQLFSNELAGLGFSITCKRACQDAK